MNDSNSNSNNDITQEISLLSIAVIKDGRVIYRSQKDQKWKLVDGHTTSDDITWLNSFEKDYRCRMVGGSIYSGAFFKFEQPHVDSESGEFYQYFVTRREIKHVKGDYYAIVSPPPKQFLNHPAPIHSIVGTNCMCTDGKVFSYDYLANVIRPMKVKRASQLWRSFLKKVHILPVSNSEIVPLTLKFDPEDHFKPLFAEKFNPSNYYLSGFFKTVDDLHSYRKTLGDSDSDSAVPKQTQVVFHAHDQIAQQIGKHDYTRMVYFCKDDPSTSTSALSKTLFILNADQPNSYSKPAHVFPSPITHLLNHSFENLIVVLLLDGSLYYVLVEDKENETIISSVEMILPVNTILVNESDVQVCGIKRRLKVDSDGICGIKKRREMDTDAY